MADKDKLDAIIDELEGKKPPPKRTRVNYSFRLDLENMKKFQSYCHSKGASPGVVMDRLVSDFLERLEERGKQEPKKGVTGRKMGMP